jgi:hypothetical protein
VTDSVGAVVAEVAVVANAAVAAEVGGVPDLAPPQPASTGTGSAARSAARSRAGGAAGVDGRRIIAGRPL